jgi:hypothetical protein
MKHQLSLTNNDHDTIWEILENFDFDRVAEVMQFLGWMWTTNDAPRVPDVNELRSEARKRCIEAISRAREIPGKELHSSCGGFDAIAEVDEDGKIWLTLQFVVTEWSNIY